MGVGEPAGLRASLDDCAERLLRYGFQLTHDSYRAQDLLQDALVRVLRYRSIEPVQSWEPYLRRVMTRCYLDQREALSAGEIPVDDLPLSAEPPVDELARTLDREALWRVLQTLPPKQRTALVLRYYLDLDEQQTAREIGCRPSTVRSLLRRGIGALRLHEQQQGGDSDERAVRATNP